ncbi:PAS domain-containing sensor histidine kinase [Gymnodinialimonas sp. 57CJ19]|uniref:PAS domain-containing sensor histidine kinase n=1 Tax=Gymnodinialimonas sp. 57CJ19 TaxID=3138498 RepID=UPI0031345308
MSKFNKTTILALALGNMLIACAIPAFFHAFVSTFAITSLVGYFGYVLLIFFIVSAITFVSLRITHDSRRAATDALVGGYDAAIGLRDKAINQHTIVCTTNGNGELKSVNENFVRAFGYSPAEVLGRTTEMLYFDDGGPKFQDVLGVAGSGGVWKGEQRLRAKDGSIVSVETTIIPRFDDLGNHLESISIRTDQTAARAKAASDSRNAVIEGLPDGVIVYDPDTYKIKYVNANGRARLKWSVNDLGDKTIFDTFKDFDKGLFRRYLEPLQSGEAQQVTLQVDHNRAPIEILTHLDTSPNGRRSLISVVRDISERRAAEKLKLTSVSTVSHELRTPLTSIKGALRLLESGGLGDMSDKAKHMIAIANRNSDRLLALVNDILVLEKIEAGEMSVTWQEVNLKDLLAEAAENHASYAEQTNVRFEVVSSEFDAVVQADPERLMQVLANLMSNAAKFSPPNGTVHLHLKDVGDAWRLCVEDHGPGIPEAARKTLFDSFFQVTADTRYSRPGTGLGLTISKRIMELHGGSISFTTELDKGTVFHCDLRKQADTQDCAA